MYMQRKEKAYFGKTSIFEETQCSNVTTASAS